MTTVYVFFAFRDESYNHFQAFCLLIFLISFVLGFLTAYDELGSDIIEFKKIR